MKGGCPSSQSLSKLIVILGVLLKQRCFIGRVTQLLKSGKASIKDVTTRGISLLHTASGLGMTCLVKFLIENGADINAPDEDGETPLHRAVSHNNNVEVTKVLINNGADSASVAVGKRTALHNIFNDSIRYILSLPNILKEIGPDSEGMSITHFLCWSRHSTLGDFEWVRTQDTIDLWAADSFGRTCLHYAALKGNIDLLAHLLDRTSPVDLDCQDTHGMTSLHCAARSSRAVLVVQMLLAKGADLNVRDAYDYGLLDHAAVWGRKENLEHHISSFR